MNIAQAAAAINGDLRPRTTYWIAITALVLVTPFTVNNFLQMRIGLAASSLAVLLILILNAWGARTRTLGPTVVLLTLVPVVAAFLALSLRTQGIIGLLWCYPAILAFYCMLPERWAWTANAVLIAVVLPSTASAIEPAVALRGAVTLIGASLFSAILVHIITCQQEQLSERVVTDPLTGLLNRHALAPTLERTIERAERDATPMALMLIDLDHFKRVNDEHGHEAGDTVLRETGALLRCRMRPGDAAFRIGGDEFLMVLNGADEADSARLAEEMREAIGTTELLAGHTLTASVGHALLDGERDRGEWIRRADSALYRAKAGGRDRVAGEPLHGV